MLRQIFFPLSKVFDSRNQQLNRLRAGSAVAPMLLRVALVAVAKATVLAIENFSLLVRYATSFTCAER